MARKVEGDGDGNNYLGNSTAIIPETRDRESLAPQARFLLCKL